MTIDQLVTAANYYVYSDFSLSDTFSDVYRLLGLQQAVVGLPHLAGQMGAACGCATNEHTDICLFNYSTTFPSNIHIVGLLYRLDFTRFYGIFFEI